MWWRSIRPRIHAWLPAGSMLEIAPGVGRWTAYLLDEADRFIAMDITPECVEVCRERFAQASHAEFQVNDGQTLPGVADASLDFAFSLDSLVHVEAPQLRQYLRELARTLKPGGAAFLHHSNLGAYVDRRTGRVASYVRERHWRAESVSARVFRQACREAGLVALSQELINWIGRDSQVDRHHLPSRQIPLTDCFSLCVRPRDGADVATKVWINRGFVDEWRELIALAGLYGRTQGDRAPASGADAIRPAAADRPRASGLSRIRPAGLRTRASGYVVTWRDPFRQAVLSGRCPDCGERAERRQDAVLCGGCRALFRLR